MLNRLSPLFHRPTRACLALFCAATMLTGCGGGGGGAADPVASEARSAFASGPITGFGSIIVNGVRFDDSTASVTDDDGNSRRSDDLRLGMMVEVSGAGITRDAVGSHSRASVIRFGSEIVGPVSSIAADGKSLVVLGQTVQITASTLFDERLAGGLGALVAGSSVVEVHGLLDTSTGSYTATRIEPKANAPFYKLRGVVSSIDKAAHTLKIGSGTDTISYDGIAADVPAALDKGVLVRVRLKTAQVDGQWIATHIESGVRRMGDHDEAELRGTITATTFPLDRKFSLNGLPVDATSALFPKGTAGIVLGARVEVEGRVVNGAVVATHVSTESEQEREHVGFELHGMISNFDAVARTFMLRGVKVSFAGDVEFRSGMMGDLAHGRMVDVTGTRSSDGTQLIAIRIGFGH